MEGEISNFTADLLLIFASLFYCHTIGKLVAEGTNPLIAILPVTFLLALLPINLTSMIFTGLTSFFITFLANFKLLMFAFGKGPLSSNPPLPLWKFFLLACLPINIVQSTSQKFKDSSNLKNAKKTETSPGILGYVTRMVIVYLAIRVNYTYKDNMHPKLGMLLNFMNIYFVLDIMIMMLGIGVWSLARVELEPHFDNPHMATSVQNFWGKRWNLSVPNVLRPTVYQPIHSISSRFVAKEWTSIPAVFATFLVSGLMHELIFYYLGRLRPTGEVISVFLLHGVWVCIEIVLKKKFAGKIMLHPVVSRIFALGFVTVTSFWLFFPPYLRFNPELRACKEIIAFIGFVKKGHLVSPNEVTCPHL